MLYRSKDYIEWTTLLIFIRPMFEEVNIHGSGNIALIGQHCVLPYLGRVCTMDHEVGPWKMAFFHGPISFKENQFTKPLSSSLGVNQMWTKRNDHVPKCECADFLDICPKKVFLKINK